MDDISQEISIMLTYTSYDGKKDNKHMLVWLLEGMDEI